MSGRDRVKLGLISLWLIFTVTFAVWWLTFSIEHLRLLAELQPENLVHWTRQKRMVLVEGSAWIVLLALGGMALAVFARRERRRTRSLREFFASFSHEVKTSLASLRLQAEALQDDVPDSPVLDRLVGDTVRLQLQLENSLFLSSQDDLKLFDERLRLADLVERMREQWPRLRIEARGDAVLFGDQRAVRTIFSNLIQNAINHGGATEVTLEARPLGHGRVGITALDNGVGFEGALAKLGTLFHRPKSTSGSGLGLYISRLLAHRMGGALNLHASNHGFRVDVTLNGEPR